MSHQKRFRSHKKNPTSAQELTFFIETMDALGQGIYRSEQGVHFISKTLPGETGRASLISRKKGVSFARLAELEEAASNRIEPSCPHYQQCPGCDYLHTDYESELAYKKAALQQHFYGLDIPEIEVLAASSRSHYRNRVQLHYRQGKLGILDGANNTILEIPQCQLAEEKLQSAIDQLYQDRSWRKKVKSQGHCEVALIDDETKVFWDKPYAYGGFSQVNSAMNAQLCDVVKQHISAINPTTLLDLFSGQGNLSNAIMADASTSRRMVDVSDYDHADFVSLDLFTEQALADFIETSGWQSVDTLLLDPPRKGFAHLHLWVEQFKPKQVVYVSCHAATLVRDIKQIDSKFTLEHVQLVDMFPGTKHFETVAVLSFL